jgi:hypothetical protein
MLWGDWWKTDGASDFSPEGTGIGTQLGHHFEISTGVKSVASCNAKRALLSLFQKKALFHKSKGSIGETVTRNATAMNMLIDCVV